MVQKLVHLSKSDVTELNKGPGCPEPPAIFTRPSVLFHVGYDTQIHSLLTVSSVALLNLQMS